jgi:nucleoside-diphosphate-sugar epimerase
MRILLTGILGDWGPDIVTALAGNGHRVTALVASEAEAACLADYGAWPVPGRLSAADDLLAAAVGHEALVHCGDERSAGPGQVVQGLLAVARNCAGLRSLIYTSSLYRLSPGICCEVDEANALARIAQRMADEALILNVATSRLNTVVVRPGQVYGAAGGYFVQYFLAARPGGLVSFVSHHKRATTFGDRAAVAGFYRRLLEDRDFAVVKASGDAVCYGPDLSRVLDELAAKGGATDMAALGWSLNQTPAAPGPLAIKPNWNSLHN